MAEKLVTFSVLDQFLRPYVKYKVHQLWPGAEEAIVWKNS